LFRPASATRVLARAIERVSRSTPYYFSSRANEPGNQHCHVTNAAGTKIQDTLARSNVRLTEESFGERRQNHCLPNQALMFGIGIAQRVMRGATARWHMPEDISMLDFAVAALNLVVTARQPAEIRTFGNAASRFNRMRGMILDVLSAMRK
jgi:hypothetical protein